MNRTWRFALAVLALGAALVIAACGGDDDGLEEGGDGGGEVETAAAEPIGGEWTISNWPLYIDKQTIDEFDQEVGANTKYIEDINDNFEFFGKLRPQLQNGDSGGRSMFVVTDYMAKIMRDLGYLQNLDKSAIPNVEENLLAEPRGPRLRPGPGVLGPVAERVHGDHHQHRPRAGDRLDRGPASTPSTRARSRSSVTCTTTSPWS